MAPHEVVFLQTTPEGKLHASRSQKDREKNPDRICLDRRGLTHLPLLIGEGKIRLLSLQHNLITRLDGFQNLGINKLVFLDIYDNQLQKIEALDNFENLRVLLIGKNRLKKIEGLTSLTKLEVLDLHGNQISQVTGLNTLCDLKVLNLAGNQIRSIGPNDLEGLISLQELNLRRNRLKKLLGFRSTLQLQKLFLSNNEILTIEDMSGVCEAVELREITVDGNPVALGNDCTSFLVSYLPQLQLLSHMQITDQVRKNAMLWRASRENVEINVIVNSSDLKSESFDSKRAEMLSNAKTNWQLLRNQAKHLSENLSQRDLTRLVDCDSESERIVPSDSVLNISSPIALPCRENKTGSKIVSKSTQSARTMAARRTMPEEYSNPCATNSLDSGECFKLPPILASLTLDKRSSSNSDSSNKHSNNSANIEQVNDGEEIFENSLSSQNISDPEDSHDVPTPLKINENNAKAEKDQNKVQMTKKEKPETVKSRPKSLQTQSKVREQGGDYLIEICGRCLNVYGQGALRFIDRPWNPSKAGDVTTVRFNYVNFTGIVSILGRLKQRFPNAENFIFRETNINCLGQLNALADAQGLSSLQIDAEGNSICQKDWRSYAVYRLSHWGLRMINGKEVTEEDIAKAEDEFEGLSEIVLRSLPDSLLQPLLTRLRIESNRSNQSAKQWLWNADAALRNVVSKEALQWRRGTVTQDDLLYRHKGRIHLSHMIDLTTAAIEKLKILESEWPSILNQIIRDTLVDYSHLESYMKNCIQQLQ
ncbi:UNVERIFIED_CONTAM: hypothetical protein PYX00_000229 [Menopon gallinae]|uniref:Dynein axonemal assembly factor 1 homolog n=1 Tax=Menopon gallinae TaxID=328185 RepID=A0AAW2I872_9NEOP